MKLNHKKKIDYLFGICLIFIFKLPTMLIGAILRRDHTPVLREAVCFIKMQGGGSLVIAYPAILALRLKYPSCRFRLVCTRQVETFAAILGVFDEIMVIDDQSITRLLTSGFRALFRNFMVDTVIDLEVYSRLTSVFALASLARNRVGFFLESTFWRKNICSHLIFFNKFSGTYYFYDLVAQLFGAVPLEFDSCKNYIRLTNDPPPFDTALYSIAVSHSCSELGRERMLNPQQWQKIISGHTLLDEAVNVIFFGSSVDAVEANQIIKYYGHTDKKINFINLCGKLSLTQSLTCIRYCNEFIGIDSGLLHFSRLMGVKSTSFWGPTDPNTRLKYDSGLDEVIYYKKIHCSPCIHVAEDPPCKGENVCIDNLFKHTVDKRLSIRIEYMLSRRGKL